jgi:hypothetical protein
MRQWGMEEWYSFLFYTLSLAFTKTSILILYTRILVHGAWRIANLMVLGIVIACNIWVLIAAFIRCIPLNAAWDPTVKGWCLGLAATRGNSILHIITDFMIFVLPLPALINLNIQVKQKIGLVLVFCLGFVWATPCCLTTTTADISQRLPLFHHPHYRSPHPRLHRLALPTLDCRISGCRRGQHRHRLRVSYHTQATCCPLLPPPSGLDGHRLVFARHQDDSHATRRYRDFKQPHKTS